MLVILDRDGVINFESDDFIKSPEEWRPIPGSLTAIAQLNQAGHKVVIASNQSGVARGLFSLATLDAIHTKMQRELEKVNGRLDGIYFCPHGPEDGCRCRKPKPGLFATIAQDFPADFATAVAVGDSLRDIQAAKAAGCQMTILVKTGRGEKTLNQNPELQESLVFADLAAVVNFLVRKN